MSESLKTGPKNPVNSLYKRLWIITAPGNIQQPHFDKKCPHSLFATEVTHLFVKYCQIVLEATFKAFGCSENFKCLQWFKVTIKSSTLHFD